MRFLADECIDAALVENLRGAGHDVRYVADVERGLTDSDVLKLVIEDERILLTEDKDFGEFVFRRNWSVPGILLLRIDPLRRALKWPRLVEALDHFGERLAGRYTVVHEDRYRSRAIPQKGD